MARPRDVPEGVGSWPFVSLNIHPDHLREWGALAKQVHRSRADLLREALEYVGLPYARGLARTQGQSASKQRAAVSAPPRVAYPSAGGG